MQFREQATLTGVAQAVVDKAVRLHHDWYMSNSINNSCSTKREDITLVLRNFNFPLPNAIKSPSISFNPFITTNSVPHTNHNSTLTSAITNDNFRDTNTSTIRTNDSSSSSCYSRTQSDCGVGPDNKVEPYVDFNEYYRKVAIMKQNGTLPPDLNF